MNTSDSVRFRAREAPVAAPDYIVDEVRRLSSASGEAFVVTPEPIEGTELFAVYATDHWLPAKYTRDKALFGFRVPGNLPLACPEDSFFLAPDDIQLVTADPVRKSQDLNRAGKTTGILKGSALGDISVLVFSWHLWNKGIWDRNKHTLLDHYQHCLRRFEQPEHD